ncbi:MAG: hypothetical protein DMG88_02850 [Acidobacteria bacterium]|nr:MAG: hypothetical protein DMG88_02850 [Acidobacteriota bacterium]
MNPDVATIEVIASLYFKSLNGEGGNTKMHLIDADETPNPTQIGIDCRTWLEGFRSALEIVPDITGTGPKNLVSKLPPTEEVVSYVTKNFSTRVAA